MSQDIPEITASEIPGLNLDRNECFDGSSLWGYMNGGADIYLEYGFVVMRVEEFSIDDEEIKLEIFKMDDPISAFGIYSFRTYKCQQSNVISTFDCLDRYQLQLIYGNYYIQLINENGSEKAKQAMVSLAETLLTKMEQKDIILPVKYLMDSMNVSPYAIKMVKGMIGIQNKAMKLSDSFEGVEGYQVYYANMEENGEKVRYYEVVFDVPAMKDTFLEINKDKGLHIIKEDNAALLMKR